MTAQLSTMLTPRFEPSHRRAEPSWLEPYPDVLLDEIADHMPGPEARYEVRESVSLAFLAALQQLPPRQRAVLVLRDVLGFRAVEVANILDTTENAVTSALKRARGALAHELPGPDWESAPLPHSPQERRIVDDFIRVFEAAGTGGWFLFRDREALSRSAPPSAGLWGPAIAGTTWDLYQGNNGWEVYSFVRPPTPPRPGSTSRTSSTTLRSNRRLSFSNY